MQTVVYTGPTLAPGQVREVLPGALTRPPVARGDLLAERWSPGDTAVIIDGYYRERLSVGHKELLWLLAEGVTVIGAASMGALRAAELGPYGMRGIGVVYDQYASGEVDGDDEVAIVHGPEEVGYPALTIALVNLRYGCREAARRGELTEELAGRIVRTAKERPFSHRTWPELAQALGPDAMDALRTLEKAIAAGDWDRKRLDALAALRAVGEERPGPVTVEARSLGTGPAEVLRWRTRREYAPGRWRSDLDVLDAARLYWSGYPELHERVLTGLLAEVAGPDGLEAYVAAKLGVEGDLPAALTGRLSATEQAQLPTAEQLRLVMVRVWPLWRCTDWRPAVVAELREHAEWERWSELVAEADEAAEQALGRVVVPPPAYCGRLFLRHWGGSQVEMARRGFGGLEELGRTVSRFFALDVRRR
ncbi:TfuA-like protein [Nonomuraea sp. NPDC050310]|uniref:TfuA-like protein n=1 Tax=Nonomuraea sp. NPDC050310 TaxID=3154935 RepID=UPI0033E0E9E6